MPYCAYMPCILLHASHVTMAGRGLVPQSGALLSVQHALGSEGHDQNALQPWGFRNRRIVMTTISINSKSMPAVLA